VAAGTHCLADGGKTVLAQSLPDAVFLNCDLPSVAERLRDPESFYQSLKQRWVVFDEVHQLPDPSRLLKMVAEALGSIRDAIQGYLELYGALDLHCEIRELEVTSS